jgi:hypothetical protein
MQIATAVMQDTVYDEYCCKLLQRTASLGRYVHSAWCTAK